MKETWQFKGDRENESYTHLESNDGRLVIQLSDEYPGYAECGQDLRMGIEPADVKLIEAAPELFEENNKLWEINSELAEALNEAMPIIERAAMSNQIALGICDRAKAALKKVGGET